MSLGLIALTILLVFLVPTAYAGWIGAPYAPTFRRAYEKAFDHINLGPDDTLIDIGSGDGKVLLEAQRRGSTAIGYELSPIFYLVSQLRAIGKKNVKILLRNFYKEELPAETTVVFAFLMPEHMDEVQQFLAKQDLPNAKYFLAYSFPLPETVKPTHIVDEPNTGKLYIYDLKPLTQ